MPWSGFLFVWVFQGSGRIGFQPSFSQGRRSYSIGAP